MTHRSLKRTLMGLCALVSASVACVHESGEAAAPSLARSRPPQANSAPTIPDRDLEAALAEAVLGVDAPALRELLRRHWAWNLEHHPLEATRLGVHAYDDRLAQLSPQVIDQEGRDLRAFLAQAVAIDRATLGERDRETLAIFEAELRAQIGGEICELQTWMLSSAHNPVAQWNYLPDLQPVTTPEEGRRYIARVRAIPALIRAQNALLADGLVAHRVTTRESARRAREMLGRQLAQPLAEWPLMAPAKASHAGWTEAQEKTFADELAAAVAEIRPAIAELTRFIDDTIMDWARSDSESGVVNLPRGLACYRSQIKLYTSLDRSPEQIHATGLAEVRRINQEMRVLGRKLFGSDDLAQILASLRDDQSLYFDSGEAVLAAARAALAAARARIPEYFGTLPQAACIVREIPDYEAPYTYIAYYRHPTPDGSKPGEYFVNTYRPETRPRYEARVLAVHESIPGHHLQLAISQELREMPAFR
ncbi:MAG TPA: DUF885 domain-containing protein, partial [Nannocystis exedens]|nr:DUF885 domain-containing protein [Nannocystis exedens]